MYHFDIDKLGELLDECKYSYNYPQTIAESILLQEEINIDQYVVADFNEYKANRLLDMSSHFRQKQNWNLADSSCAEELKNSIKTYLIVSGIKYESYIDKGEMLKEFMEDPVMPDEDGFYHFYKKVESQFFRIYKKIIGYSEIIPIDMDLIIVDVVRSFKMSIQYGPIEAYTFDETYFMYGLLHELDNIATRK